MSERKLNHEAWARSMIGFIRERGLESEFQGWCGGWPCRVASPDEPPPSLHREPIEADREAAAPFFPSMGIIAPREVRIGLADHTDLVQAFMRHRLAFSTPAASDAEALPADVVALVIAAREAWEVDAVSGNALDRALEKFASRVPYENEPDDARALPLPKAGEMETETAFEIWEDDLMVASASTEAEGLHYFAVYSQDGPVKLVRAETVRQVIATPSTEGHKGEDQADG